MRLYFLARKATDSVRSGFLPAAARLGLTVTVLTDHPDEHRDLDPSVEVLDCEVSDFHAVITRISTQSFREHFSNEARTPFREHFR